MYDANDDQPEYPSASSLLSRIKPPLLTGTSFTEHVRRRIRLSLPASTDLTLYKPKLVRWELKVETLQLLKRPPAEEQPPQWVSTVAGAATVLQSPTALRLLHFISSADRFPSAGAEYSRLSELQLSKLPDRKILKIQKILKEKQSLNKI